MCQGFRRSFVEVKDTRVDSLGRNSSEGIFIAEDKNVFKEIRVFLRSDFSTFLRTYFWLLISKLIFLFSI